MRTPRTPGRVWAAALGATVGTVVGATVGATAGALVVASHLRRTRNDPDVDDEPDAAEAATNRSSPTATPAQDDRGFFAPPH